MHSFSLGTPDPVFDPITGSLVKTVDTARALAEVQDSFNDGSAIESAHALRCRPLRHGVHRWPSASHILRTMEQVVVNDTIPGAFGNSKSKLIVINSSDAYVEGVAGLLHAHWLLPGYQPDYCAPGGNLVFELRQSRSGQEFVRVFYTAQTSDQLRNLTPLTLDQPPATMQVFIPGGSKSATSLDVDFQTFDKILKKEISEKYVQDPATEVPPGVLTGVPRQ